MWIEGEGRIVLGFMEEEGKPVKDVLCCDVVLEETRGR